MKLYTVLQVGLTTVFLIAAWKVWGWIAPVIILGAFIITTALRVRSGRWQSLNSWAWYDALLSIAFLSIGLIAAHLAWGIVSMLSLLVILIVTIVLTVQSEIRNIFHV